MQRTHFVVLTLVCLLSCAYANNVFGWGRNTYGQIGDSTNTTRQQPQISPFNTDLISRMANGAAHTVWLGVDGRVWTLGNNDFGQLGDGSVTSRTNAVEVELPKKIISIAAGAYFSLAVSEDRKSLYSWGDNRFGQLGDDTFTMKPSPIAVPWSNSQSLTIAEIAAGANHVLIKASDNSLWTFGSNSHGQLGDGTTTDRATSAKVNFASSLGVPRTIAAGYYHNVVIATNGKLLIWGSNVFGELGIGSTSLSVTSVQSTALNTKSAAFVAAGRHFTIAAATDNQFYSCGLNSNGQLAAQTEITFRATPEQISLPIRMTEKQPYMVVAGADFVLFSNVDNKVFGWGNNQHYQLATSTVANFTAAAPVDAAGSNLLSGQHITWISAGLDFAMAAVNANESSWHKTAIGVGVGITVGSIILGCVIGILRIRFGR